MAVDRVKERPNLSSHLAQQVLTMIRERDLGPGDRLPSAKALATEFRVATPTIREALRRLQGTGVIDIRHGSGIFVRQSRERLMLSNPNYGTLEHHTVVQLLDARLLIEPHLAERAANHATEHEIDVIEHAVRDSEALLSRHDDAYFRLNGQFHAAIARAAGNVILAQIVVSMIEVYASELHLFDPDRTLEEVRTSDHQEHVQIAAAVREGNGQLAHESMRHHLHAARLRVERHANQEECGPAGLKINLNR